MTTPRLTAARSLFTGDRRADVRRLVVCLGLALVVALMTGPPGSGSEPTRGIRGSLFHVRVFGYLALGVAVWAVVTAYLHFADRIRGVATTATGTWRQAFAPRRVRYPAYVVLLVV